MAQTFFSHCFSLIFVACTEHPWLHDSKKMPDIPLGDAVRARLQQFAAMNKLKKKALKVAFIIC
jgi:hypothetical protein